MTTALEGFRIEKARFERDLANDILLRVNQFHADTGEWPVNLGINLYTYMALGEQQAAVVNVETSLTFNL